MGRGDPAAFQALYMATSSRLFKICFQVVQEEDLAQDVLQDAYLNIWKKAVTYKSSQTSPLRWLIAVTRNCAIDSTREKKRRSIALTDGAASIALTDGAASIALTYGAASLVDPTPLPDALLIEAEDWRFLYKCISRLDERDARFITSAFIGELTHADISEQEQQPLGSVKSVIRRALFKLRKRMESKRDKPR